MKKDWSVEVYNEGISQEEYAVMQVQIQEKIERLKSRLKKNSTELLSCRGCNYVFHEKSLIGGYCNYCNSDRNTIKKEKVDLTFYLMCKCDMYNGRICDMTKEEIDDTWYLDDLDNIIILGQETCSNFRRESCQ